MKENIELIKWKELSGKFWDIRTSRQRWLNNYVLYPHIIKIISEFKHDNILDYGCGDGSLCKILRETFIDSNVYAFDIIEEMREIAKKNIGCNVMSEINEEKFDLICMNMVIQDVDDPRSIFLKLKAQLAENGHIIFTIPHPVFSLIEEDHVTTIREKIIPSNKKGIFRYKHEETEKVIWNKENRNNWSYLYNRMLETYSRIIFDVGMSIDLLSEPGPIEEGVCEKDLFDINMKAPRALIICVHK